MRAELEAGAADRRRLHRRARRRLRRRLRGRRARSSGTRAASTASRRTDPRRRASFSRATGRGSGMLGVSGNRQPVSLQGVSPVMRKAIVDTEDRRFYENNGIDYIGILRALKSDVSSGGYAQGASTIEQQLVRNLYLTPAAVAQPEDRPRPASPSRWTSSGARTGSSRRTSTTSTSGRRRTGSTPPPRRTSASTRRISRSTRRRCSRGCRRRRRRTTRSTGRTPRGHDARRSCTRCSQAGDISAAATDRLCTVHSACTHEQHPDSRVRRT